MNPSGLDKTFLTGEQISTIHEDDSQYDANSPDSALSKKGLDQSRAVHLLNSSSGESFDQPGQSTIETSPVQFYDNMLYFVEKLNLPKVK